MQRIRLLEVAIVASFIGFVPASPGARADSEEKDQNLRQGVSVYMQAHCYVCHGQFGSGTLGPKFAGDLNLQDKNYVATQILVGLGEMPAYAHRLTDGQVAAVASYVRNSWGNAFGPVTPKDVAQARELRQQAVQQTVAPAHP